MDTISYSDFRSNLTKHMDNVNQSQKPLLVTRENSKHVVVMSLDNFQSYEETAYLMASPKNAERLNRSISEITNSQSKQLR